MNAPDSRPSMLRTLVLLGRVSNLPTVWANCLAGWLLTGTPPQPSLALVMVSATCLYTGGMFLNDACDVAFDRQFRPERPIPRGLISSRSVYSLATLFLMAGVVLMSVLGPHAAGVSLLIVGAVTGYNWIHKRWIGAIGLMALSRMLLYWLAGVVAASQPSVLIPSIGLGTYVLGISLAARADDAGASVPHWILGFLILPIPLAVLVASPPTLILTGAAALLLLLWILRISQGERAGGRVPRLLAGMPLVDLLFVASVAGPYWSFPLFAVLLALALLLQKKVPAS